MRKCTLAKTYGDHEVAEKLPVIIDNRKNNTVLRALQKLMPNLQKMDVATGTFEIGSFLLLESLAAGQ